jgi:hypothetical protein
LEVEMDGTEYEAHIGELKQRMAGLRKLMDSFHTNWLRLVGEALVSWYESTMKKVVTEQYHLVETLGPAGTMALKERFIGLLQGTVPAVKERLSEPVFWLHKQERLQLSDPLAKVDAYSVDQSGFLSLMRGELATLFGRLSTFLRVNGFSTPKEVREAENPKSNFPHIAALNTQREVVETIAGYAGFHSELIRAAARVAELEKQWAAAVAQDRELQKQRRIEQAKKNALDVWENAFSRGFGQDIDWNKAWDKADNYWGDHDEWGDRYDAWLIDASPKAGEDDFETFLVNTGNQEKYERQIKRVWKIGLLKSVFRQLGKSQWEAWIQQLIDEQVAMRIIANEFPSYGSLLEHYREHICRDCSRYLEEKEETCEVCDKCDECCKCYAENSEEDEEVDVD